MLDWRSGDDHVPEPHRRRARHRPRADHGRQLEMVGDRGGPEVRAGQGDRQFDQPERRRRGRFAAQARLVRRYGAAVVVMAFDEKGQADTVERQSRRSATRAYKLLTEEVGFPPEDIIFDPEHPDRRRPASKSTTTTRSNSSRPRGRSRPLCPAARFSGGVSNISFSFRGNDAVREAMHAAFLYHAIRAGWTWASSTPGSWRSTRRSPRTCWNSSKTCCSIAGPTRPSGCVAFAETVKQKGKVGRRGEDALAQGHRRGAAVARAGQGHRRIHRRGHRRSAAEIRQRRWRSSKAR